MGNELKQAIKTIETTWRHKRLLKNHYYSVRYNTMLQLLEEGEYFKARDILSELNKILFD